MNIKNEEKDIIVDRVFNLLFNRRFTEDLYKFAVGDVENADEYELYLRRRIQSHLFPEEKDGQNESNDLI